MKELFDINDIKEQKEVYTSKIKAPTYTPKNKRPYLMELYNDIKTQRLINDINSSNLNDDEKQFLIKASHRHTVFNYSRIADYYSHSSKEFQLLAEKSALVIIDFEKAIENGFAQLNEKIKNIYLSEKYNEE